MQVIEKVKVVPEGYNGAGMDGYGRRGRGRSSRSMSPRNEIGFRRNSRRDEEYREDDDRHIMRILGYGYDGDDGNKVWKYFNEM